MTFVNEILLSDSQDVVHKPIQHQSGWETPEHCRKENRHKLKQLCLFIICCGWSH